jgi:hypothetical protein
MKKNKAQKEWACVESKMPWKKCIKLSPLLNYNILIFILFLSDLKYIYGFVNLNFIIFL